MYSTKGILVSVDMEQKEEIVVGGKTLSLASLYTANYRHKSPVVAVVVQGNKAVRKGAVLVVHHNHFHTESPYAIGDGLFSIPVNRSIFFEINDQGNPLAMCGNIIAERVEKTAGLLEIPESMKKNYNDRVVVLQDACGFNKGDMLITWPFSDYEVVYQWGNIMHRVIKVYNEDVCAVLRAKNGK